MSFGKRVAMTLRWAALEVSAGLAVLAGSVYGLMINEPHPVDQPFESPIPFAILFKLGIVFGISIVVRAHFKANKQ